MINSYKLCILGFAACLYILDPKLQETIFLGKQITTFWTDILVPYYIPTPGRGRVKIQNGYRQINNTDAPAQKYVYLGISQILCGIAQMV